MSGPVKACRSCGSPTLIDVLDLGEMPIANALLGADDEGTDEPVHPLSVVFCAGCSLVQLGHALSAADIFDDAYPYYSSFSETLGRHAADHVAGLIEARDLDGSSFMVEVASNDGYLLRHALAAGVRVLGVDPSPGPAAAAEAIGVPTITEFFGLDLARAIRHEHGEADVIVANNVMAHVPDLNDFVAGLAELLAQDGLLTIENPYVRDLVQHVEFDTIYHEHYCYFSCSAVEVLMARHGLHLNDVEYFPDLHGGTLRWHVGALANRTLRCRRYLDDESEAGMTTFDFYAGLRDRVHTCQTVLREWLDDTVRAGGTIAAYGAAAKGATLLNSVGVTTREIEYVVDRNVHKQHRLMPGCRLPIRPTSALVENPPDHVLILAWNFAEEIVAQQSEYLATGGSFFVPVPLLRRADAGPTQP